MRSLRRVRVPFAFMVLSLFALTTNLYSDWHTISIKDVTISSSQEFSDDNDRDDSLYVKDVLVRVGAGDGGRLSSGYANTQAAPLLKFSTNPSTGPPTV